MPDKVVAIAEQTAAATVAECAQRAKMQVKTAMQALPSEEARPFERAIEQFEKKVMESASPHIAQPLGRTRPRSAAQPQAMAMSGPGSNEVPTSRISQALAATASIVNTGSVGHPELCSRPCLFFMEGRCENGSMCGFCHLPHPKRASHLDKRHRELVRAMSYESLLDIMRPLLREKMEALGFKDEDMTILNHMCAKQNAAGRPSAEPKMGRSMLVALKSLSMRSLLVLLRRAGEEQSTEAAASVEALMQHIRFSARIKPAAATGSR